MKITDIFRKHKKTFSFEFFPPKDEISAVDLGINIGQLMKLSPSFLTVTYGAGGSTQQRTFTLVDYLQNKIGITCMAHYTCVEAPKEKIKDDIITLSEKGIENLMLLRGDPPKGHDKFQKVADGFAHADDLIRFVRDLGDFAIGAAAYPEKHPESSDMESEFKYMKKKIDAGADFLITQLFFDNDHYFDFVENARKNGITCRIIPGIIPVTNVQQIKKFTQLTGAIIPEELKEIIEPLEHDPKKVYRAGIEYAIEQCRDLLLKGAPGIHFYTLNKSRATVEIFESLILR